MENRDAQEKRKKKNEGASSQARQLGSPSGKNRKRTDNRDVIDGTSGGEKEPGQI